MSSKNKIISKCYTSNTNKKLKNIIGSSPTEFTLVDYPTMDELEIY
jgi:hypothetical protein